MIRKPTHHRYVEKRLKEKIINGIPNITEYQKEKIKDDDDFIYEILNDFEIYESVEYEPSNFFKRLLLIPLYIFAIVLITTTPLQIILTGQKYSNDLHYKLYKKQKEVLTKKRG